MFIDTQTQNRIHANLDESVSYATMRAQDLIPVFLEVMKDTPEYIQIMQTMPSYPFDDDSGSWWDSEESTYYLETIWDTLDSYAPDGYYFGAHVGDGSDYGYWKFEEEI